MTLVNDKYSILGMVRGLAVSLTEDISRCDVKVRILSRYGNGIHWLLLQKKFPLVSNSDNNRSISIVFKFPLIFAPIKRTSKL